MGMDQDPGWRMRADILRRDAERKLLDPLRAHGWDAEVERVEAAGEYAVITAERNGLRRRAALLYSSATANEVYRRLEREVDVTLFNGAPYQVAEFTRGLLRPVCSADDFHLRLVEWNRDSIPDRLAPAASQAEQFGETNPREQRIRRLLSETPIDAIRSRLARLRSPTLARKAVGSRATAEGRDLTTPILERKGDGTAYAIRSATDYFALKDVGNVSQRVLSLYYGCVSFAFAEMLASPDGPEELSRIEDITKQGHGLWTVDGPEDGFGALAVGPAESGFFPSWMRSLHTGPLTAMSKKPRRPGDLTGAPSGSWATMEQLFSRVPEVADLFEDVFPGPPAWVAPVYDHAANRPPALFGNGERAKTSYVLLVDRTGRMTADMVGSLPGPLREITPIPSGTRVRHFRAAVDHLNSELWWGALNVHHSPFERDALILPLFGCVDQYRAICVVILYALSIVVRYRPSLWHRIQEGDLDHMRALIEAFLGVAERLMPQHFLESITGERISVHQPGSLFS